MPNDTIPRRLVEQAARRPDAPAYLVRGAGGYAPTSYATYLAEVRRAGRALMALGFEAGDKVCILGFNRPEWVIVDLAAMYAGGVPAGIYTTCSASEVQYIIDHAEAAVVVIEDEGQWRKIAAERERLPKLRHVVWMSGASPIDDPLVMSWEDFLARADEVPQSELDARLDALQLEAPATFIYTSGTTGPPKAVMVSHHNLAWTARAAADLVGMVDGDCALSYLPLSHIAEQMFSIHAPVTAGAAVYFAESLASVLDNLVEVQPTVFFGVPRIWEKFHAGVAGKLAGAPPLRSAIARWAQDVGRRASHATMRGEAPSGLLSLQRALARRLVFGKVKRALGLGRARICVSGAAPIGRDVLEFFAGFDVIVLEVYGQSEDTGPTSFNQPGRARFGTVGPIFPGVEVRIAADGEILVRGPNVFLGYYKDEAATAETLVDGWLHSGDLGAFDPDGFLTITGRKKEIIITAGGKNIAPRNLEEALKALPLVAEAVVIGDRRRFLSALLVLEPDAAARFAAEHRVVGPVHESEAVRRELERGIASVNAQFAQVEHIRKYVVLPEPLSVERGELTPSLKVKRRVVEQAYAAQIEAMYE